MVPPAESSVTSTRARSAPGKKEKAVSCLFAICSGDEGSSQTVLQVGVFPALVSVSANGSARVRDMAQWLLGLFREQWQRELEQEEMRPRVELHEVASRAAVQQQREEEEEEMALAVLPAAAVSKPCGGPMAGSDVPMA